MGGWRHVGIGNVRLGLAPKGRLGVTLRDAATGVVVVRERADNLIVTTGIAALAEALNYALIVAENASWGSPATAPFGAFYAAVGTGTSTPVAGNTKLSAEIGRAIVSNYAVSAEVLTYDFFFPTTLGNGTIHEIGTFGAADYIAPLLNSALTSGNSYTSLALSGLVGTIPSGSALVVGYSTGTTKSVTTTAEVTTGATSVSVSSFTANANYAAGSLVAYKPGTLIDRAALGSAVTKTSSETMTVELELTLESG